MLTLDEDLRKDILKFQRRAERVAEEREDDVVQLDDD